MDFKKELTSIITEKHPQYKDWGEDKLFKLILAKAFKGLISISKSFDKLNSFFTDFKKDNQKQLGNTEQIHNVLKQIKTSISGTPYEKHFITLIEKLDEFKQQSVNEYLNKILVELKKNKFPDKMFLGGSKGLDQEDKTILRAIRDNTDELEVNVENINFDTTALEAKIDELKSLQDPLAAYQIVNVDDIVSSPDFEWFGYMDLNGNWYILQKEYNFSDFPTYRYATLVNNPGYIGDSGYENAFTDRADLTYDLPNIAFA